MHKELALSEHIQHHSNESMERALLAERHPLWARSCPELKDIDFLFALGYYAVSVRWIVVAIFSKLMKRFMASCFHTQRILNH